MAVTELGTAATGTGTAVSLPTGWAAGDLAIALVGRSLTGTLTLTGFTTIFSVDSGAAPHLAMFYRVLVAGDTTFTYTPNTGTHPWACIAFLKNTYDSTSPIGDFQTNTSAVSANTSVAPAVSGLQNSYLVNGFTILTASTGTAPGTSTERADLAGAGGNPPIIQLNVEALASTASTGTRTETLNVTTAAARVMGSVIIKPAALIAKQNITNQAVKRASLW